jgi:hypothetical protein
MSEEMFREVDSWGKWKVGSHERKRLTWESTGVGFPVIDTYCLEMYQARWCNSAEGRVIDAWNSCVQPSCRPRSDQGPKGLGWR